MNVTVVLAATVVALLILILLPLGSPQILIAIGTLAWSINISWIVPAPRGAGPILGSIVFLVAWLRAAPRRRIRWSRPWIQFIPLLAGAVGMVLLPWSISPKESLTAVAYAIGFGILVVMIGQRFPGQIVARAMFGALTILIVTSVLVCISGAGSAIVAGRWAGITGNPNSLGLIVFLWASLSFSMGRKAWLIVFPFAYLVVFLTGSRGSALALTASLIVGLLINARLHSRSRIVMGIGAAASLLAFMGLTVHAMQPSGLPGGSAILRTGDSGRVTIAEVTAELFQLRPWTGYGFDVTVVPDQSFAAPHAFPLTMALELGVSGILLVIAFASALLATRWSHSAPLGALVFGTLISMVSESWEFGFGSVICVVFWMATVALACNPGDEDDGGVERKEWAIRAELSESRVSGVAATG